MEANDNAGNYKSSLIFLVLAVLGITLRILVSFRGHNFDVESYRIVADIVSVGGNVYKETNRYNYGPIWFHILHFLDSIPWGGSGTFLGLRFKVAGFLTLVDFLIYLFLFKKYSLKIAALFFLNPISIIITGYHSQFDNLAVLIGLISVAIYSISQSSRIRIICLAGIGLSLCVKHILFAFPIWLAIKERNWIGKLMVLIIPYMIFVSSFFWYLPEGATGMLGNVFLYRSFSNAPFWANFAPNLILSIFPTVLLFVGVLFILGFYWRDRNQLDSLHFYLISVVVFSSAIANQYLSISAPSLAVFWNLGYAFYTFVGAIFLTVEGNGLHIEFVRDFIGWRGEYGYNILIFLLSVGLLITAAGYGKLSEFVKPIRTFAQWILAEILIQIKSPWR